MRLEVEIFPSRRAEACDPEPTEAIGTVTLHGRHDGGPIEEVEAGIRSIDAQAILLVDTDTYGEWTDHDLACLRRYRSETLRLSAPVPCGNCRASCSLPRAALGLSPAVRGSRRALHRQPPRLGTSTTSPKRPRAASGHRKVQTPLVIVCRCAQRSDGLPSVPRRDVTLGTINKGGYPRRMGARVTRGAVVRDTRREPGITRYVRPYADPPAPSVASQWACPENHIPLVRR